MKIGEIVKQKVYRTIFSIEINLIRFILKRYQHSNVTYSCIVSKVIHLKLYFRCHTSFYTKHEYLSRQINEESSHGVVINNEFLSLLHVTTLSSNLWYLIKHIYRHLIISGTSRNFAQKCRICFNHHLFYTNIYVTAS